MKLEIDFHNDFYVNATTSLLTLSSDFIKHNDRVKISFRVLKRNFPVSEFQFFTNKNEVGIKFYHIFLNAMQCKDLFEN